MAIFNIGATGGGGGLIGNIGDTIAGSVVAPTITSIPAGGFNASRWPLIYGSFPMASYVGRLGFFQQIDADIYLPAITTLSQIGNQAFISCKMVHLPNLEDLEGYYVSSSSYYGFSTSYVGISDICAYGTIDIPKITNFASFYTGTFNYMTVRAEGITTLPQAGWCWASGSLEAPNLSGTLALTTSDMNQFRSCAGLITPNLTIQCASSFMFLMGGYLQTLDCILPSIPAQYFCALDAQSSINSVLNSVTIRGNVTTIGSSAFQSCRALQTVNISTATTINANAFSGCVNLINCSFSTVTFVGNGAFYSCSCLRNIDFLSMASTQSVQTNIAELLCNCNPKHLTLYMASGYVGNWGLSGAQIETINLSKITSIYSQAFYGCWYLSIVSLKAIKTIQSSAFQQCIMLHTFDLSQVSQVPTLSMDVFAYTPMVSSDFYGYYGSIYVPKSLYNSFKTATNWTTYSARMVSV